MWVCVLYTLSCVIYATFRCGFHCGPVRECAFVFWSTCVCDSWADGSCKIPHWASQRGSWWELTGSESEGGWKRKMEVRVEWGGGGCWLAASLMIEGLEKSWAAVGGLHCYRLDLVECYPHGAPWMYQYQLGVKQLFPCKYVHMVNMSGFIDKLENRAGITEG